MKAFVLLCDRCASEGKADVRAVHVAWIRTSLGGRSIRLDVCAEHLAMILGQPSSNGGPVVAPNANAHAPHRMMLKSRVSYDKLLAFVAKHPRFSFEDARAYLGKDVSEQSAGRALAYLVDDGKLERYALGVYQRPGFSIAAPATVELAGAAALKIIKARPGSRGVFVAALAGIESEKLWKPTLAYLRENKRIRTKGDKSGMRLYPL